MPCSKPSSRPSALAQLVVGVALDVGDADVGDDLLDQPAVLVDPRRLDPQEPARGRGRCGRSRPGRRRGARRSCRRRRPAGQLGPQDVHPALQHPAHVGEVGLLLLRLAAAGPQLVEVEVGQVVGEALRQHLVDPAAPVRVGLVGTHRDSPAVTDVRSLTRSSARASSVVIGGRWASRASSAARRHQLGVAGRPAGPWRRSACPPCRPAGGRPRPAQRARPAASYGRCRWRTRTHPPGSAATAATSAAAVPGMPPGTPMTRSQWTWPPYGGAVGVEQPVQRRDVAEVEQLELGHDLGGLGALVELGHERPRVLERRRRRS